jgi:hypothetical protein
MYRLITFGITLTAAALLCWPAQVLAGQTVSYKDSVEGTATLEPSLPTVLVQILGTGEGSHLGRFQVNGGHTLLFTPPPTTGGTVNGQATYTVKDGSTIQITYSGTFTNGPNHRLLDLQAQFGQGTGRLAGVTGSAATIVIVSPVPGSPLDTTFTYTSEGTLTFP